MQSSDEEDHEEKENSTRNLIYDKNLGDKISDEEKEV